MNEKIDSPASKPGRRKSSQGLQATLERLTGRTPCPKHLRSAANKYLATELFQDPDAPGRKLTNEQKLALPGAEVLLLNALTLDEVFRGEVKPVVAVLTGTMDKGEIQKRLSDAGGQMRERIDIYSYFEGRLPALENLLLAQSLDFRGQQLDSALNDASRPIAGRAFSSFALRAVRQLERVEQSSRVSGFNAADYVEQAEAYIVLGDLKTAGQKARDATNLDSANPRAWFLRVVTALRRCNEAGREVQHYEVEAVEIAEPMSAHERSAYEMHAEAADRFGAAQKDLEEILPQALLHWPRLGKSNFEHRDLRGLVRDQFLEHIFRRMAVGDGLCDSRLAVLNDRGPEWMLRLDNPQIRQLPDAPELADLPLTLAEREALSLLFEEHARYRSSFFTIGDAGYLARDFQLLHLRWLLRDPNYAWHWEEWSRDALGSLPDYFEARILRNANLARLWVGHVARHDGASTVVQVLSQWRGRAQKQRDNEVRDRNLQILLMVFHHQIAREDFVGCWATCLAAEALDLTENGHRQFFDHPMESMITIPAGNRLYWQYMKALCAVKARFAGCTLNEDASEFLAQAESWRQRFEQRENCFWNCAEFYEDGGGEDYPVAPYDIDLTVPDKWQSPTLGRDDPFENFVVVGVAS